MTFASEPMCGPPNVALDDEGRPLLRLPGKWSGMPLGLFPIPGCEERGPEHTPHPLVLVALQGRGRRWCRVNGRTRELTTAPDMIELHGRDYQKEGSRWEGQEGRCVAVHLPPDTVGRLLHEPAFDLALRHELFDARLQWLVIELLEEARRGAPGGALYVEGLSIALLGRLREHYLNEAPPTGRQGAGLAPLLQQRVLDCIEAHLGEDLSVTRLAQEAGLSPDRFAHCFKTSFGCSPHRFVQQRRIETAQRMLTGSSRPIAEIALALGFSSQSHFTQAFRQATGTTPARARNP